MIDIRIIGLAILIVTLIAFHIHKTGRLFAIPVFFNAYAFLYFVVGCAYYYQDVHLGVMTYEVELIVYLCFFAVLAFNASYTFFSRGEGRRSGLEGGYIPRFDTLLLVIFVALIAELFVIGAVGPYKYFFIDRLDRFPIMKNYQSILYVANLFNIALPFAIARYNSTNAVLDKRLLYFILAHNLIFAVVLISRSALVFNFICLFYFLEFRGVFRRGALMLGGALMVIIMFFYKGFLYGFILDKEYESFNPGEFINWVRNSEIMLSNGFDSSILPNNSYLLAIKSLVVISPDEDAISEWFIEEFYSDRVVSGLTYGFSGLLEGYLYLGVLGVILHFSVIGVLFGLIERIKGSLKYVISVCLMFIMFRLFRSEIYNFTKTFSWFYMYQVLFIFALNGLVKWYNRNKILWR